MSETKAREGQWYVDRAHHEFFLVIAIDESDGLIDVRDRYGDIDEFDLDEWDAMDLVCAPRPRSGGRTRSRGPTERTGLNTARIRSRDGPHHFKSSGTT